MKHIAKGAEANLYKDDGKLVKTRVRKEYRIPELDKRLRKSRTRKEAKNLERLGRAGVNVPKVYNVDEKKTTIVMEYIDGKLLKDVIDREDDKVISEIGQQIGSILAKIHANDIVHNDLTTSNMILQDNEICIIDLGLGFHSTRIEDKAMDLVVLKKSLLATHPSKSKRIWESTIKGYAGKKEILNRVEKIEKRVRYA